MDYNHQCTVHTYELMGKPACAVRGSSEFFVLIDDTFCLTFEGLLFLGITKACKRIWSKKIPGCLAKFWVNGPCFVQNLPIFLNFQGFGIFKRSKFILKVLIFNTYMSICINNDFYAIKKNFPSLSWQ